MSWALIAIVYMLTEFFKGCAASLLRGYLREALLLWGLS
jgi:hypothetical protein